MVRLQSSVLAYVGLCYLSLPWVSLVDSDAHTLEQGLVSCLGHLEWDQGFTEKE